VLVVISVCFCFAPILLMYCYYVCSMNGPSDWCLRMCSNQPVNWRSLQPSKTSSNSCKLKSVSFCNCILYINSGQSKAELSSGTYHDELKWVLVALIGWNLELRNGPNCGRATRLSASVGFALWPGALPLDPLGAQPSSQDHHYSCRLVMVYSSVASGILLLPLDIKLLRCTGNTL